MSDIEKESAHDIHTERIGDINVKYVSDTKGLQTREVQNAEFAAAKEAGRISPWTREAFMMYWCCFVSFLCACANGYDGSLMGAINTMKPYQNTLKPGVEGSGTGLIFSIYTIGQIFGGLQSGQVMDRFGRRVGMFYGCLILCLGSAIVTSANHKQQFIAGRFILGWGIAIAASSAPSYCIEIAPPQWRGRMLAFYNCGWFGGSIPAAGVTLGTSYNTTNLSWRLPLGLQCVPAGFVLFCVWFLPESPRWLVANGRDEEARAILVKYHGQGDPNNPYVALEWKEFKESISTDGSDKRWYDYSELYNTHNARWRLLMVAFMGVFGQFSGNGLGYFNNQIFEALGYSGVIPWVLNLGVSLVSATGAGIGVSLTDTMPRRPVLYIGTFLLSIFLGINGALSALWNNQAGSAHPNLKLGQGAVASYFLFNFAYSFTYTPLQALYPVECLHTNSRGKGMGTYQAIVNCISFINLYCIPVAQKNIQYRFVFVFVGWDVVESILWFLFGIETNGRTLEELDEIFSAPNPVKASIVKKKVAVQGRDILVVD